MNQTRKKEIWSRFLGRETVRDKPSAHIPRIVPAQAVSVVHPVMQAQFLPAHIHRDQIELEFWALFTIHADGTAAVEMIESTGYALFDSLALDAARRWRFQAATQDGEPVESYLRLKIEFDTAPTLRRRGVSTKSVPSRNGPKTGPQDG